MSKTFYVLIVALLISGCATYRGVYDVTLKSVERPEDARERYGEYVISESEEEGRSKYSYEDDMIEIVWFVTASRFNFSLKNKTEYSIKIIWDEAVFVDENGSSERVMHTGVTYADRNNSQPPTIVVSNSSVEDVIIPNDNVYYQSGQYGGWRVNPIFPNSSDTEMGLNNIVQQYVGKEVRIILPLQIEETINEYSFTFKAEDFVRTKFTDTASY